MAPNSSTVFNEWRISKCLILPLFNNKLTSLEKKINLLNAKYQLFVCVCLICVRCLTVEVSAMLRVRNWFLCLFFCFKLILLCYVVLIVWFVPSLPVLLAILPQFSCYSSVLPHPFTPVRCLIKLSCLPSPHQLHSMSLCLRSPISSPLLCFHALPSSSPCHLLESLLQWQLCFIFLF